MARRLLHREEVFDLELQPRFVDLQVRIGIRRRVLKQTHSGSCLLRTRALEATCHLAGSAPQAVIDRVKERETLALAGTCRSTSSRAPRGEGGGGCTILKSDCAPGDWTGGRRASAGGCKDDPQDPFHRRGRRERCLPSERSSRALSRQQESAWSIISTSSRVLLDGRHHCAGPRGTFAARSSRSTESAPQTFPEGRRRVPKQWVKRGAGPRQLQVQRRVASLVRSLTCSVAAPGRSMTWRLDPCLQLREAEGARFQDRPPSALRDGPASAWPVDVAALPPLVAYILLAIRSRTSPPLIDALISG